MPIVSTEEVVIQVSRLGLRSDVSSLRRYLRRLLRDRAAALTEGGREKIAGLLADEAAAGVSTRAVEDLHRSDEATSFVTVDNPVLDESPPLLPPGVQAEIEQVIQEHQRVQELEAADLVPTRTLLLTGAPGVGKSMTARFIAARLGIPLFRADLSALMSSYLGKTGQNLRSALLHARSEPTVMLLDEFDAIAKRRDDPSDIGELKRIVNVLLVELEDWPAASLLVAATNHPELLDRAIWRRFERVISIGLPSDETRDALLRRQLARHGRTIKTETAAAFVAATSGCSGADLATMIRTAIRRVVLDSNADLESTMLDEALERLKGRAQADDGGARTTYCRVSREVLGLSQREIAAKLGVSHVTVGNILRDRLGSVGRSRRAKKDARA